MIARQLLIQPNGAKSHRHGSHLRDGFPTDERFFVLLFVFDRQHG